MSVLIKGINMPKEPWDCPCHDGETGFCKVTSIGCYDYIPKCCPLVEVPTPHGDLADKDVIVENIRQRLGIRNLDYLLETEKPIAMSIKEAPTIIEAEE